MCHSPPCTQAAQTTHGLAPTAHRWDGGNNNKGQPGPDTPQRIRPRRAKLESAVAAKNKGATLMNPNKVFWEKGDFTRIA